MSAKDAVALFNTDCKISVFDAELRDPLLRVHVYPRKSEPGFIWILREGEMDLDDIDGCVVDGNVTATNCNVHDAAAMAVSALFLRAANRYLGE